MRRLGLAGLQRALGLRQRGVGLALLGDPLCAAPRPVAALVRLPRFRLALRRLVEPPGGARLVGAREDGLRAELALRQVVDAVARVGRFQLGGTAQVLQARRELAPLDLLQAFVVVLLCSAAGEQQRGDQGGEEWRAGNQGIPPPPGGFRVTLLFTCWETSSCAEIAVSR